MRASTKRVLIILAVTLAVACNKVPQSAKELPRDVQKKVDEGQPGASYQISAKDGATVYVITYGSDFCGSSGCSQVVFIEDDGKLQKAFDGLAEMINPNFERPGELRFNFLLSGLACGKVGNSSPCEREMLWTNGKLVELKR